MAEHIFIKLGMDIMEPEHTTDAHFKYSRSSNNNITDAKSCEMGGHSSKMLQLPMIPHNDVMTLLLMMV